MKKTHKISISLITPWEDQCEWHKRTRMTGPDCAVICNLINIYRHTNTHTSHLIRGFRDNYQPYSLEKINASGIE